MEWVCHSSALCLWIWSNRNCLKTKCSAIQRSGLGQKFWSRVFSHRNVLVRRAELSSVFRGIFSFSCQLWKCRKSEGLSAGLHHLYSLTEFLTISDDRFLSLPKAVGQALPMAYFAYSGNSSPWSWGHIKMLAGAVDTVWLSLPQMYAAKLN